MQTSLLRKLAIAALVVAAPAGFAAAADMPVKVRPAPTPVFSWTGFYVGGYAGTSWMDQVNTTDPCLVGVACLATGTYNGVPPSIYDMKEGFVGGLEFGYNWQVNPYLLLGLENKFGYLHLKGSYIQNPPPIGNSDTTASTTVGNWYDALTARIGMVSGQMMLFVEGGGAWTRVKAGVVDTTAPVTINTVTTKNAAGFAAGAGVEYALNKNWSLKAEYLFLGLSGTINQCAQVGGFPAGTIDCTRSHYAGVQTIDFGVNFHWN
jgi:outer membrane immunogenic protein